MVVEERLQGRVVVRESGLAIHQKIRQVADVGLLKVDQRRAGRTGDGGSAADVFTLASESKTYQGVGGVEAGSEERVQLEGMQLGRLAHAVADELGDVALVKSFVGLGSGREGTKSAEQSSISRRRWAAYGGKGWGFPAVWYSLSLCFSCLSAS